MVASRQPPTLTLDKLAFDNAVVEPVIENVSGPSRSGTILGNVKHLASASRSEVKIPNGVCGIRGTRFQVTLRACSQLSKAPLKFDILIRPTLALRLWLRCQPGQTFHTATGQCKISKS